MAVNSLFNSDFRINGVDPDINDANRDIPFLSTSLDSIRVYNFEIRISNPSVRPKGLVLAAKKVSSSGHKVENIAVRRLNDTFYYPGGADSDELTITFDHLANSLAINDMYSWFKACTYNPENGIVAASTNTKASILDVLYLGNDRSVLKAVSYHGAYPMSFKPAESNYNTNNEFHTFEVGFRYDFMTYYGTGGGRQSISGVRGGASLPDGDIAPPPGT